MTTREEIIAMQDQSYTSTGSLLPPYATVDRAEERRQDEEARRTEKNLETRSRVFFVTGHVKDVSRADEAVRELLRVCGIPINERGAWEKRTSHEDARRIRKRVKELGGYAHVLDEDGEQVG